MVDPVEAIKEKMVMACKVLQNQGALDGYGHVSARLPNKQILSTPHRPPGKVAVRDLIIIGMDGKKSTPTGVFSTIISPRSSTEVRAEFNV